MQRQEEREGEKFSGGISSELKKDKGTKEQRNLYTYKGQKACGGIIE